MLPTLFNRKPYHTPSVVDDFLSNGFFSPLFSFEPSRDNMRLPAVNVEEREKEYIIDAAAPGLDKNDFNVSLNENVLTISSKLENTSESNNEGLIRREFNFSSFSRSFTLPKDADGNNIKASHKNGILTVSIPKIEQKQKAQKEIAIN